MKYLLTKSKIRKYLKGTQHTNQRLEVQNPSKSISFHGRGVSGHRRGGGCEALCLQGPLCTYGSLCAQPGAQGCPCPSGPSAEMAEGALALQLGPGSYRPHTPTPGLRRAPIQGRKEPRHAAPRTQRRRESDHGLPLPTPFPRGQHWGAVGAQAGGEDTGRVTATDHQPSVTPAAKFAAVPVQGSGEILRNWTGLALISTLSQAEGRFENHNQRLTANTSKSGRRGHLEGGCCGHRQAPILFHIRANDLEDNK